MVLRTAWGIALLVGASCVGAVGCGASGGAAIISETGTTSAGSGGASGDADAADDGEAGSSSESDASADQSDAADHESERLFDANDVCIGPDVAMEATRDVRIDTESATDATLADAGVDHGFSIDAPPSSGMNCVERCNGNADCMPVLPVAEFECDLNTHRCISCKNDLACVAAASGWLVGCTKSSDCTSIIGDVCIDVNGAGKCAVSTASCGGAFPDDIDAREFSTGAAVKVCGVASSACQEGRCVDRCSTIHTCTPEQGGRVCNGSTGGCECVDDNDCSGGVGVSRCNKTTKQCECAGNADCAGVDDVDICVDGKCRCSTVNVCKRDFTGTTLSCE